MNARVHGKALSLSYNAIIIFEQLIPSSKAHSPNGIHEIMQITNALKKNAHDLNDQTMHVFSMR